MPSICTSLQRDADDSIRKELSDLKAQVAINAARPYQISFIHVRLDKAFTAGINYTDRKILAMFFWTGCTSWILLLQQKGYVGANRMWCPMVVQLLQPQPPNFR